MLSYPLCTVRQRERPSEEDRMAKVMAGEGSVTVEVATEDELRASIERQVRDLGLSLAELAEQAVDDSFISEQARRLWFMVSPLAAEQE